jgi:hypothetical protein
MPRHDGFGFDDDQCRAPVAPNARPRDPEGPISGTPTRSFLYGAAKKVNLVTPGQVLELEVGP